MQRIAERVNGRWGGYVRKVARNSMKRARRKTSLSQLTPEQLIAYNAARRRWHQRGRTGKEPQLPPEPSRPGEPPRVVGGQIKNLIKYDRYSESGRLMVIVGPEVLSGSQRNKGEAPSLHENSGAGFGSGYVIVRFPRRSFMQPAAEKAMPHVRSWIRQAAATSR